ncbi:MAG TPA: cupin domain-containing protein [Gaiellaceae bacterium]
MKYCLQPADASPIEEENGVEVRTLFGSERGCNEFEQRVLRFDGASLLRTSAGADEVLYVLAGTGTAVLDGERTELSAGSAAYIARGASWQVEEAQELDVLSVLVHGPGSANGTHHAVLAAEETERGSATAGRQFSLLATPDVGCAAVTQFVGYIPVVRAPDHFHTYDEVVYVLQGQGALHVGGDSVPLQPGSSVYLPARLVHCLENTGPGEMRVLGVFRPAGSPAEAYYPDGTQAQY